MFSEPSSGKPSLWAAVGWPYYEKKMIKNISENLLLVTQMIDQPGSLLQQGCRTARLFDRQKLLSEPLLGKPRTWG